MKEGYKEYCVKLEEEHPDTFAFWKKTTYFGFFVLLLLVLYVGCSLIGIGRITGLLTIGIECATVVFLVQGSTKLIFGLTLSAIVGFLSLLSLFVDALTVSLIVEAFTQSPITVKYLFIFETVTPLMFAIAAVYYRTSIARAQLYKIQEIKQLQQEYLQTRE